MKNIFYGFIILSASVSGQSWPSRQPDVQSVSFKPDTFSILDYQAKADGLALNTKAINSAIEKCHQHGGGTVLIPVNAGNCRNLLFDHIAYKADKVFIRVSGSRSKNISIVGCRLRRGDSAVALGPGVEPDVLHYE